MDDAKFEVRLEPDRKGRMVHARVSADEYAAIEKAAKAADMTVSGFFRSLVIEGAGARPFLTEEDRLVMALLLEDMRAIGVNLNQVARALNSGKGVHPSDVDIQSRERATRPSGRYDGVAIAGEARRPQAARGGVRRGNLLRRIHERMGASPCGVAA